jgi:hypothetical protein
MYQGTLTTRYAPVSLEIQHGFQGRSALVVEHVVIPVPFDDFGNDHGDLAVGILARELQDVVHNRRDDETIGRGKHHQFRRVHAELQDRLFHESVPLLPEEYGVFSGIDVQGDDIGRDIQRRR